MRTRGVLISIFLGLSFAAVMMTGCGSGVGINSGGGGAINCAGCGTTGGGGGTTGGGGVGSTTNGQMSLTMVDPPTCATPRFPFSHIYVTVKSVQLNTLANATISNTGWVEAAPALNTSPKQIDLFAAPTMGNLSGGGLVEIPVGTYKSAMLMLSTDPTNVAGNQCGGYTNCAVYGAQTIPIDVTGINGIVVSGPTLQNGQVVVNTTPSGINFLFDSCASVLATSSSSMRLIPKVFAWGGTVSTWSVGLSDAVTNSRIGSSDGIVAFEQADASGVYRIVAQAATDATGNATVYVPPGTYDVVATATATSGGAAQTIYSPMVVAGVSSVSGSNSLSISLPQAGPALPATINGTVVTQTTGTAPDLRIGVLQKGTFNGGISQPYTIPILADWSSMTNTATTAGNGCPVGATCVNYSIQVPGQPLYHRTFADATASASASANNYTVDSLVFKQMGGGVTTCSTPEQTTSTDVNNGTITLAPGDSTTAATLNYTGCQ